MKVPSIIALLIVTPWAWLMIRFLTFGSFWDVIPMVFFVYLLSSWVREIHREKQNAVKTNESHPVENESTTEIERHGIEEFTPNKDEMESQYDGLKERDNHYSEDEEQYMDCIGEVEDKVNKEENDLVIKDLITEIEEQELNECKENQDPVKFQQDELISEKRYSSSKNEGQNKYRMGEKEDRLYEEQTDKDQCLIELQQNNPASEREYASSTNEGHENGNILKKADKVCDEQTESDKDLLELLSDGPAFKRAYDSLTNEGQENGNILEKERLCDEETEFDKDLIELLHDDPDFGRACQENGNILEKENRVCDEQTEFDKDLIELLNDVPAFERTNDSSTNEGQENGNILEKEYRVCDEETEFDKNLIELLSDEPAFERAYDSLTNESQESCNIQEKGDRMCNEKTEFDKDLIELLHDDPIFEKGNESSINSAQETGKIGEKENAMNEEEAELETKDLTIEIIEKELSQCREDKNLVKDQQNYLIFRKTTISKEQDSNVLKVGKDRTEVELLHHVRKDIFLTDSENKRDNLKEKVIEPQNPKFSEFDDYLDAMTIILQNALLDTGDESSKNNMHDIGNCDKIRNAEKDEKDMLVSKKDNSTQTIQQIRKETIQDRLVQSCIDLSSLDSLLSGEVEELGSETEKHNSQSLDVQGKQDSSMVLILDYKKSSEKLCPQEGVFKSFKLPFVEENVPEDQINREKNRTEECLSPSIGGQENPDSSMVEAGDEMDSNEKFYRLDGPSRHFAIPFIEENVTKTQIISEGSKTEDQNLSSPDELTMQVSIVVETGIENHDDETEESNSPSFDSKVVLQDLEMNGSENEENTFERLYNQDRFSEVFEPRFIQEKVTKDQSKGLENKKEINHQPSFDSLKIKDSNMIDAVTKENTYKSFWTQGGASRNYELHPIEENEDRNQKQPKKRSFLRRKFKKFKRIFKKKRHNDM